jgi:uncharacterized protein YndB with AHSA1/START domain
MEFLGGAGRAAPGVRVRVQAWNGLSMEVEYLTVDPPSRVAMRMLRGPRSFETFAGTWRFEGEPGGGTLVTFRYGFRTRWRWLRPLLDPVAAAVLRRDVRSRLRGLARGAGRPELMERLGAD